jgi:hypothetical protein
MSRLAAFLVAMLAALAVNAVSAQPVPDRGGPSWSSLTPAQRSALAPLESQWSAIDPQRKQKWIDIAGRLPNMPAEERDRIQQRMGNWAQLSAKERGQARLQYQESRQLTPQERQERWEAYQALPPEQRKDLARRSTPQGTASKRNDNPAAAPKSNIVALPSSTAPATAVAPTVVQMKPGATTTLVTRPGNPPAHQQTGLPKIAATPGFVDSTTLLPKRGPQGAAAGPTAPASQPTRRP